MKKDALGPAQTVKRNVFACLLFTIPSRHLINPSTRPHIHTHTPTHTHTHAHTYTPTHPHTSTHTHTHPHIHTHTRPHTSTHAHTHHISKRRTRRAKRAEWGSRHSQAFHPVFEFIASVNRSCCLRLSLVVSVSFSVSLRPFLKLMLGSIFGWFLVVVSNSKVIVK